MDKVGKCRVRTACRRSLARWIIACLLLGLTAIASSTEVAAPLVVRFDNLSESVVLERQASGLYRKRGENRLVGLGRGIVLKVSRDTTRAVLAGMAPDAQRVDDLFVGTGFRYVLLTYADQGRAMQALQALQKHPRVLLAQPDMRQRKTAAEIVNSPASAQHVALPEYLSLAQRAGLWPGNAGHGVKVAVIDEGFALQHPQLAGLKVGLHYDFATHRLHASQDLQEPAPASAVSHGTKLVGILFAAQDGRAPEGLVPGAELLAISQASTWTSETLQAFHLAALAGADVINCSWHSQWLLQPVRDVVDELARHGREGKGTAVVFAAGNQGIQLVASQHEATIESAIVVGAKGRDGQPLALSNRGETVDVWSFGGTAGTLGAGESDITVSGTSLAAAITTGYIALMLAADPDLSLAQLQERLGLLLQ